MEHVVFFAAHDGSPAFRRLESLEEAVRFVEHLRNMEGVEQASVHALTEVPLSFKAYYRVEMPAEPQPGQQPVPVDTVPVPVQPGEPAPLAMVVVDGGAQGAGEAPEVPPLLAEVPVPAAAPEQAQQPAEPAKASMGFFSRG